MITPIFTEKSLKEAKGGKYTFLVDRNLTKNQIAPIVAEMFGVTVIDVRTTKVSGETGKNARGKRFTRIAGKKAIITLKDKEKIDIFDEGKK